MTRSAIRFTFLQDREFQSRSDKLQQCSSTILGLLELRCRQSMRPRVVLRCTCAYLLTSYRWQANVVEILSESSKKSRLQVGSTGVVPDYMTDASTMCKRDLCCRFPLLDDCSKIEERP